MDISDDHGLSHLKGALKLFKEGLQEQTFESQGIPGFFMMTRRGECSTCEMYAAHAIAVARSPTVAIPIKFAFQTVWPQVVTHIEDDAMDEAHRKLSWFQDLYEEVTKSIKALEEKLSSKKDHHCKAETKQSKLETELDNFQKKLKLLGKCKACPISCKWCEWEFKLDLDTSERPLSKGSRKQQRCDHTAPVRYTYIISQVYT